MHRFTVYRYDYECDGTEYETDDIADAVNKAVELESANKNTPNEYVYQYLIGVNF